MKDEQSNPLKKTPNANFHILELKMINTKIKNVQL